MRTLQFPQDFTSRPHPNIGGTQWLFEYNDETNEVISIVGGGYGMHGNGTTTFEMWDTKNMEDPEGNMTAEDINQWLKDHPIKE